MTIFAGQAESFGTVQRPFLFCVLGINRSILRARIFMKVNRQSFELFGLVIRCKLLSAHISRAARRISLTKGEYRFTEGEIKLFQNFPEYNFTPKFQKCE